MPYTRGQQVEVWIDQNNPTACHNNPISNWQWTPAVVIYYVDTPPCVTCIVASWPYMQHPILTSVWQTTQTFNSADVRPLGGDAGAGFGL
eukprot:14220209-Ditylum_brightwellii.AAC.1